MPLSLDLSHRILRVLADIRREGKVMTYVRPNGKEVTYLRPDAKSQVTIEYGEDGKPQRVHTIVVSTQHDEFIVPTKENGLTQDEADAQMLARIREDVIHVLIPRVIAEMDDERVKGLFQEGITYHVNPTGKFVIGGPHGDTGLTGRKIIVDTYGGRGAHGGGAFSGKDSSKVDRSAAYAARHIAKNMVVAGVADEMLVQLSYAIGVAQPVSIYVNTYGTAKVGLSDGEIAQKIGELFDLRPKAIEERFDLRKPIYQETASYGHFGRKTEKVVKKFTNHYQGDKEIEVTLFPWEETEKYQERIKRELRVES